MFGRNKKSSENAGSVVADATPVASETPEATQSGYTAPKGRPTPSRKEREAARRTPLVPADRKAAKDAQREADREFRAKQQQALQTGDERYLPANDRGPQRRYIRDYVDARFNVGDIMIIVILAVFIVGLFSPSMQQYTILLMWGMILLWVIDYMIMWRGLKKKLTEKFGSIEPRSGFYAFNRVMMIRRFRLPKPQVKRGEYPK
ncbi:DUF3043 domain-containing protein [Rothia nasimurium]|uniref:DUF3043 domain-containing protein n=1 Tax=Rothia nasimurium TaxID=85336 RepID=A0A4Y9F4J9_9MICC|nr:DUF3043 domain-containing protein [Rothia nasimurium]TFU23049.1 DUF3043 domain-containing protein [Rothia nasimurium]